MVKEMLASRAGEPPLSGREARLVVAALDANGNGALSREEFEGGLKECRCELLTGPHMTASPRPKFSNTALSAGNMTRPLYRYAIRPLCCALRDAEDSKTQNGS